MVKNVFIFEIIRGRLKSSGYRIQTKALQIISTL